MWSGDTRSQGGPYSTQWALNPAAYMNVPNEQVDWATLAQQWIKMKEGYPQVEKEGGEAPMEITKEDSVVPESSEDLSASQHSWPSNTQPADGGWPANWSWDQSSGWCWTGVGSGEGKVAPQFAASYTSVPEPAITPHDQSTTQQPYSYSSQPPESQYPNNPGYWTSESNIKDQWEPPITRGNKKHSTQESSSELDSNKRKQLPAWIREGLEKMEREKQKKAESERLHRERLHQISHLKEEDVKKKESVETNGSPALPKKSRFETDSEDSEPEKVATPVQKVAEKPHRSRFDWKPASPPAAVIPHRTKEEILQHVMVQVRKILTQLLTEVTTEEMMSVCEQVFSQYQRKAPATTVRKTQALASLTGKLGLGIYDSEDSSSDSSEEEGRAQSVDSDQELRERIRRRKEEFAETERRIEREIAEQEEKERRVLLGKQDNSREPSPGSEEQVHPSQPVASSGGAKLERKTSRDSSESKRTSESRDGRSRRSESRERGNGGTRRQSTESSSSSSSSSSSEEEEESRSPSPRRRKHHSHHHHHGHGSRRHRRRSSEGSSRGRRSRSREERRRRGGGGRRSRSRSSSRSHRQRRRHTSTSSSDGGRNKRSRRR